jgi:hypothetical protein
MTSSYGKINFGLEEETGLWFAYSNIYPNGGDFAQSSKSLEDAFMILADLLVNKLNNISVVISKPTDNLIREGTEQ